MMESLLLLLLALGGGGGAPAASPGFAATPGRAVPVTGVWRGTWLATGGRTPVPVEAVLAPGRQKGTLIAVVMSGVGRDRRTARLSGLYDSDGAKLALPSGGALRLHPEGGSRLIGEIKGGGPAGFLPGDGALELTRVRR
jgi:hypothetical protein